MEYKKREEVVGKRFLCVGHCAKLKSQDIRAWKWRVGVIRAATQSQFVHPENKLLVEYHGQVWQKREWLALQDVQVFLVERDLVWAPRHAANTSQHPSLQAGQLSCESEQQSTTPPLLYWPALTFSTLVDRGKHCCRSEVQPAQFLPLDDDCLHFFHYNESLLFKEGEDSRRDKQFTSNSRALREANRWLEYQQGQQILLQTPSVLVGYRLQVYRVDGTTQWYTAVIKSYNEATRTLDITDDTVLEEHCEDPALVQMHLIGDGVISSILRGEDCRVRPSRTRRSLHNHESVNRTLVNKSSVNSSSVSPAAVVKSSSVAIDACSSPLANSPPSPPTTQQLKLSTSSIHSRKKADKTETSAPDNLDNHTDSSQKPPAKAKSHDHPSSHSKIVPSSPDLSAKEEILSELSGSASTSVNSPTSPVSPNLNHKGRNRRKKGKSAGRVSEDDTGTSSDSSSVRGLEKTNGVFLDCAQHVKNGDETGTDRVKKARSRSTLLPPSWQNKHSSSSSKADLDSLSSTADMHFKKKHLLNDVSGSGGSGSKENGGAAADHSAIVSGDEQKVERMSGINLNHSLTDQLAKLSRGANGSDVRARNWEDMAAATSLASMSSHQRESPAPQHTAHRTEPDRPRSTPDSAVMEHNNNKDIDRFNNRGTRPGSGDRFSDQGRDSSTASSPLLVDRSKPIEPYRDPELLKKDSEMRHRIMHQPSSSQAPSATASASPSSAPATSASFTSVPMGTPMSTHTTHATHPLLAALPGYPHPAAGLSPAHILSLDRSGLAGLSLVQQQAAAAHLQQLQLLQSQGLLQPYSLHNPNPLQTRQLELLWQQKYPNSALPPPWMLHQYQEDLLRDVTLMQQRAAAGDMASTMERERREIAERERVERERGERERAERERVERQAAQERQERERRERDERERLELDRLERERAEREKAAAAAAERERKERDERRLVAEQERVRLTTSASAAADAVNQHFQESLRLAKEKMARGGTWNPTPSLAGEPGAMGPLRGGKGPPSSLPSSGMPSAFTAPPHQQQQHLKQNTAAASLISPPPRDKLTSEMEDKAHSQRVLQSFQQHHEAIKRISQHPDSDKHKQRTGGGTISKEVGDKTAGAYLPSNSSTGGPPSSYASSHKPAQPIFSLYGYQAGVHDQHFSPLEAHKHGRSESPSNMVTHKKMLPSQQQQQQQHKDGGAASSSVIVENRPVMTSYHPVSGGSITLGTARAGSNTVKADTKPVVLAPASMHPQHPALTSHNKLQHSRHINQPQQTSAPANMQPLDLKFKPAVKDSVLHAAQQQGPPPPSSKLSSGGGGGSSGGPPANLQAYMASLGPHHHAMASSTATTTVNTYSLIQQGLVPNPMHTSQQPMPAPSTGMKMASTEASPAHQYTSIPASAAPNSHHPPPPPHTALPPAKRRMHQKDGERSKKSKVGQVSPPQSAPSTVAFTTATSIQAASLTTSSTIPSHSPTGVSPPCTTGAKPNVTNSYIDSFRSFVEKTVHSAFLNDHELNRAGCKPVNHSPVTTVRTGSPAITTEQQATNMLLQQQKTATMATMGAVTTTTVTSVGPVCSTDTQPCAVTTVSTSSTFPHLATHTPSSSTNSTSSLMDTINRVANGLDTDSDTLSVPSPPPSAKADSLKTSSASSNHTKFKKAWLQRYSDEDKKQSPSPIQPDLMDDCSNEGEREGAKSGDSMKDCYVNCSYISPTKDGANKSPISMLKDLTRASKDEDGATTNSASEGEALSTDSSSTKKSKTNKRHSDSPSGVSSKKVKKEPGANNPIPEPPQRPLTPQNAAPSTGAVKKRRKVKSHKSKSRPFQMEDESAEDSDAKPVTSRIPTPVGNPMEPVTSICLPVKKESPPPSPPARPAITSDCEAKMMNRLRERRDNNVKRESPSAILTSKPLNHETMDSLKKTMEPFSQDDSCFEITPKLMKCRECRMTPHQKNKKMPNIFCRFYAFRRLRYSSKGYLTIAGFSEPSDADADDIELWMPLLPVSEPRLDVEMAKYIMANVADRFCDLVEQEKGAMAWVSPDTKIAWKRAVQGVREMCDACDTTLFNFHWVCHKCGFVVCLDCYRLRMRKMQATQGAPICADPTCTTCEGQGQRWLSCSANRQPHEPDKLMITQIIPSDVLWVLGRKIHEVRDKWGIQAQCPCVRSRVDQALKTNGLSSQIKSHALNGISEGSKGSKKNALPPCLSENGPGSMSPLNLLAEAAASRESEETKMSGGEEGGKSCSTLRDLLTKKAKAGKQAAAAAAAVTANENKKAPALSSLDDIIQNVAESLQGSRRIAGGGNEKKSSTLAHYVPRHGSSILPGREGPIPCYTLTETSLLFPDVPHSWLDHGRLLRLLEPTNATNIRLFQQQWRRAQPVLVSSCDKNLDMEQWKPSTFSREFGHIDNDLVNCQTNVVLIGHKMRVFWDNFERLSTRLKDSKHKPMILKLKDWPPSEDFADLMPQRFQDLMQGLPLPEYTQRNGVFNLASRLPEFFVKPDLGPKMYNAYGSSLSPKTGSTNIHLDMSDAVNIMLYVGIPDDDKENQEKGAVNAMVKAGCCDATLERARNGEKPGALWHIFDPQDADKIRDLLNKVAKERGEKIETHHDPIHDQSWYLDEDLRERLLAEYAVQGYTIVQFLGDAVFIPCGAPHQVRNLHSCIKAAEDFVSPENMNYCFKMTQEFRYLSDSHSNHEDKLQIKNIIFHAMKDAVAVLGEDCH